MTSRQLALLLLALAFVVAMYGARGLTLTEALAFLPHAGGDQP